MMMIPVPDRQRPELSCTSIVLRMSGPVSRILVGSEVPNRIAQKSSSLLAE